MDTPSIAMDSLAFSKIDSERPFYIPIGMEVSVFEAAAHKQLPVMLKGPTGCGKTRLVEHMAHRLGVPLYTVSCHEDLTASDLLGRYVLVGGDTKWVDGPLTRAVREGGICYLDEIVEARQDTTVSIHSLADHRRELNIERLGGLKLRAAKGFMLVLSYNPGYQSVLKDMKMSTRQRMICIELGFPPPDIEQQIVMTEAGISSSVAEDLVHLGQSIRKVRDSRLREAASTRMLLAAGALISAGLTYRDAAIAAIAGPITDDQELRDGLIAMIESYGQGE